MFHLLFAAPMKWLTQVATFLVLARLAFTSDDDLGTDWVWHVPA